MLIRSPLGKLAEVVEDFLGVGMEDVRPILMNQHAGSVVLVVGIAADVHALIDDEDLVAGVGREPFRHDRPGKAGSDNEVVEHSAPISAMREWIARAAAALYAHAAATHHGRAR